MAAFGRVDDDEQILAHADHAELSDVSATSQALRTLLTGCLLFCIVSVSLLIPALLSGFSGRILAN